MRGCRLLELRVVSVWVMKDGVLFKYSWKRSCYRKRKQQIQGLIPWNTERDGSWLGCVAMDADRLSVVCKVGENQSRVVACIPISWWTRCSSMLWSIVSKAADKSKRASRETFPSSKARRRSLTIFVLSAVSVLYPCPLLCSSLLSRQDNPSSVCKKLPNLCVPGKTLYTAGTKLSNQ